MYNKIVIFTQSRDFFGAQIMCIPLVDELKKKYPNSQITLFSKYSITKVIEPLDIIDNVIVESDRIKVLKKYIEINPDISISLRKQSFFTDFIISFFNSKTKIGYESFLSKIFFTKTSKYIFNTYRARNYLNLIDKKFTPKPSSPKNNVLIIPGAGGDFKMWNIDNYIKLAKKLKEEYSDFEIRFLLGNKEKEFAKKISNEFNVYINLDINSLFELVKEASLVIANDCGPSHIAQIIDTNVLILYSDEFENADKTISEWFNTKENSYYIVGSSRNKIDSIEVKSVFNTAKKILNRGKK